MKKRNNKIIILISAGIIFIVSLLIFILNYSKDDTSYSLLEKKWLKDNENNVIDVSVYNVVSIFGENGNGVIFDYLDSFNEEYGINFNKVSYLENQEDNNVNYKKVAFKILDSSSKISKNDILIYEDKYIIVSKDKKIYNNLNELDSIKLATFESDLSLASYYLNGVNISFKPYKDIDSMLTAIEDDEIDCLLLPFNQYLSIILENELNIVYHVEDITKKYVINVNDNDTLLNILKKYTLKYKNEDYEEVYKNNFINLIFSSKKISEEEKMSYNANSYIYGYVTNTPFEVN